jgi:hypothetical protein
VGIEVSSFVDVMFCWRLEEGKRERNWYGYSTTVLVERFLRAQTVRIQKIAFSVVVRMRLEAYDRLAISLNIWINILGFC